MLGPMTEIMAQNNDNWYQDNSAKQIKSMTGGISDILTAISGSLPGIVTGMKTAMADITDPKSFEEKARALGVAMKAIATIAGVAGDVYAFASGQEGYVFGPSTTEIIDNMFTSLADLFTPMGGISLVVRRMRKVMEANKFPAQEESSAFGDGLGTMIDITKSIIELSEFYNPKRQRQMNDFGAAIKNWGDNSATDYWGPSDIIHQLVGEAKRISVAMKDLDIDLQEIALKPVMDDILGAKGSRAFTIEPKGVNIKVNFNVTMNAEELATAIYKGNKEDKGGFFQLTEQVDAAELEGTAGA